MNALSKLFEVLHLSRGEMTLRRSHRRRRSRRQGSALSCETLESKQLLAADLVAPISADPVVVTDAPVAISLEGKFQDTAVSGTVVKFETNAPLADNDFYVELTSNTPLTNTNFLSYVNSGAYDNSQIHRSVSGFVIQGGGFKVPTFAADQPGSDPVAIPTTGTVQNESGNPNTRGTIAMAKLSNQPDSATSQFFFNLSDNSFLDSDNDGFTQFGSVLGSGMTVVDTMGSALTYDATAYYANTALSDLPLWNVNQDNNGSVIVQPQDFVQIENADEVTESALFTYQVSSSDTAKLTASLDGNGNLLLTPVGDASGSVDVTVTATSRLDNSIASDTFTVQLNGGGGPVDPGPIDPGPVLTPVEAQGLVTLAQDTDGNLYANDIAITKRGRAMSINDPTTSFSCTPLAVETNIPKGDSTVNSMLLKADDGSIWRLEMNENWEYVRFFGANDTPGTAGFYNAESNFNIDVNNDDLVGAPALTPVEAQGLVTLAQDTDGNLYANDIAITKRGRAMSINDPTTSFSCTPLAVETNIPKGDSTVNSMLLKADDGSIWRLEMNENWEYVRFFGANDTPGTAGFYNAESNFNIDVNNDDLVGAPALTPVEAQGSVTLAQDTDGNLYANDIAITKRGKAMSINDPTTSFGCTPLAVETNIPKGDSTVNSMLLKADDGSIWRLEMNENWEYVRFFGANDTPGTAGFYNAESNFNIDVNNDDLVGAPALTPVEAQGSVTLAQDTDGNLYANDIAITKRGKAMSINDPTTSFSCTPLAVETNIPKGDSTVNSMLLKADDGSIWRLEMNENWEYVRFFGANDTLGTAGFNNAELNFNIDVNNDGQVGAPVLTPVEAQGSVTLAQDTDGNLYANDIAITKRGRAMSINDPTTSFSCTPLAVETNIPKGDSTVNSMLLKADDGSIWRLEMNENWEYVRFFGANDTPGTAGFYNAESNFNIDVNNDDFVGAPALTPVEAQGSVTLAQDTDGNLYANDIAITKRGKAMSINDPTTSFGCTPLAVETNIPKGDSTVNSMLLKADDGSIWRLEMNENWEYVRFFGANDTPGTAGFYNAESNFNIDVNNDDLVGAPALTPVEAQGSVTLAQDTDGNLYANDIAITKRGKAMSINDPTTSFSCTPLAVETNIPKGDSTVNSMLLKADDGSIWRLEMNENWEYVRFFGANDTLGTAGFNNAELNFNIDVNNDGQVGAPVLTPVEAQGSVTLAQDTDGNLYANDIAITKRGRAMSINDPTTSFSCTPLAVETNIPKGDSTVNSMLLKADDGSIWRLEMNENWEYVRFFGANDTPGTAGFYNAESNFNIDVNNDDFVGAPALTPVEAQGSVTLAQDTDGNLYANDIAITKRGKAMSINDPTTSFGCTPLAVETNIPKGDSTVNSMLLKADDGSIWRLEMNENWEYVRFFGANDTPGTAGFLASEIRFQIDIDGDLNIGS